MKTHEVELCYAWQETEDGIYHAFEVMDAKLSVDYDATAKKLAGLLDTTPNDERFGWSSMRVSLPESVVNRILTDADRLTVNTPLGDIVADISPGSDYPGVWVSLHRDNEDYDPPLALVEYTSDEADLEYPAIITRVWGNAEQEDYTKRIVHKGIEECFSTEEVEIDDKAEEPSHGDY